MFCFVEFTQRGGDYTCQNCRGLPTYGPTLKDLPPVRDRPRIDEVPICEWCDRPFAAGTGRGRKYCSNACENYGLGRARTSSDLTFGDCVQCGSLFVRPAHHEFDTCSPQCTKRRRKYHRRQLRRAENGGETFTLREIAERDGWRCHICGKRVPDRQYAARDDDPTLDHLVPVSLGGKHVRVNVALAHNRCNWERGDMPIEFQMRLIA